MIQRVQSLFLFFAITLNLVIFIYGPIGLIVDLVDSREWNVKPNELINLTNNYENEFVFSSIFILVSTVLAIFALFMFKNRLLQLRLLRFSRFFLGVVLIVSAVFESVLLAFVGYAPLLFPWILLILSTYFIKKDEKLVRSADRIR